jgi:predicted nucleic acid-binding protein
MSGKAFLDTNIFVYSYDPDEPRKQALAHDLIKATTDEQEAVISYQVIHEFFNVVFRKAAVRMTFADGQQTLGGLFTRMTIIPSSLALISEAIRIQERFRLSWYDSLIVSAAQYAGCSTLYSEDLQHGQQFGAMTVLDPFR